MFNKYKIKYENNEEVLYLYFDTDYEFSLDFLSNFNFNKINFKGNIIKILVSGIVVSTILLNPISTNNKQVVNTDLNSVIMEVLKENNNTSKNDIKEDIKTIDNSNNSSKEEIDKKSNSVNKEETNKKNTNVTQTNNNKNVNKTSSTTTIKQQETQKPKSNTTDNNTYVTLKRTNGKVQKIELEEYLIGVVGAEMPASFNIEALKAQAVVARTYTLKKVKNNQVLTDNVNDQVYKSNDELKAMWGSSYNSYYNKIKNAVNSTKGQYITYNGNYIEAVYHSTSNGKTEDSVEVWGNNYNYLKSVDSSWDRSASSYERVINISYSDISAKLGFDVNKDTSIDIISRTNGNRVKTIKIRDTYYTGVEIRKLLNLRSADFEISKTNNGLSIKTHGYGHGVGMSQYGAQGMANSGYNYIQIIKHYYTGVNVV